MSSKTMDTLLQFMNQMKIQPETAGERIRLVFDTLDGTWKEDIEEAVPESIFANFVLDAENSKGTKSIPDGVLQTFLVSTLNQLLTEKKFSAAAIRCGLDFSALRSILRLQTRPASPTVEYLIYRLTGKQVFLR